MIALSIISGSVALAGLFTNPVVFPTWWGRQIEDGRPYLFFHALLTGFATVIFILSRRGL